LPQLFSGNPTPGNSAPVAAQVGCTSIVCTWDVALAGNYFLEVTGNVTSAGFSILNVPVGYAGAFVASPNPTFVSNSPLPAALPLFASGLGAIAGFAWWRKRKAAGMAAA